MELSISIEDGSRAAALFGPTDSNLRSLRSAFDVRLTARDGTIHLSGEPSSVRKAADALALLQRRLRSVELLTDEDVDDAIQEASVDPASRAAAPATLRGSGARLTAKTPGQEAYIRAIHGCDLTFCLGPAGSGKTYLAVGVALELLRQRRIERIVLVRPAVEAGERLGYLPGDIQAKVNPYLRPLFDALHDMMGIDQIRRLVDNDVIEIVPLAFMRGRTLSKAVIILDEAQNTTTGQMLMFLTRLGHDAKMVVTGDVSQSDLSPGQRSGLLDAVSRLGKTKGVEVIRLTKVDIVRHPLVQRVVEAYGLRDD